MKDTLKQLDKKIDQQEALLGQYRRESETEGRKYDSEDNIKYEDRLIERFRALLNQFTAETQRRRLDKHSKQAEDCKPALDRAARTIAGITDRTYDLDSLRDLVEGIYTCPRVDELDSQNEKRRKTSRYAIAAKIHEWECYKVILLVAMESNWARLPKYKISYFRDSIPEPSRACLEIMFIALERWGSHGALLKCPVFLERFKEFKQSLETPSLATASSAPPSTDLDYLPDYDSEVSSRNLSEAQPSQGNGKQPGSRNPRIAQKFTETSLSVHSSSFQLSNSTSSICTTPCAGMLAAQQAQLTPPFINDHPSIAPKCLSQQKVQDTASEEVFAFSHATISTVPSISGVLTDALRKGTRSEREEGNLSSKLVTVVISTDEKDHSGVFIRVDRSYAFEIREKLVMRREKLSNTKHLVAM